MLSEYVRRRGVLTLEEAVRKMTAFPAQRIGLLDRGVLPPGMRADVVVFGPARDAVTFEHPHQHADGFSLVTVNGEIVLEGGRITEARPGVVLHGPAVR